MTNTLPSWEFIYLLPWCRRITRLCWFGNHETCGARLPPIIPWNRLIIFFNCCLLTLQKKSFPSCLNLSFTSPWVAIMILGKKKPTKTLIVSLHGFITCTLSSTTFSAKLSKGLASVLHNWALGSWTLDKGLHLLTFQQPTSALLMSSAFKHLSTFPSNICLTFRACSLLNPYHHYHSLQTDHFPWVFYQRKLASTRDRFFLLDWEPSNLQIYSWSTNIFT